MLESKLRTLLKLRSMTPAQLGRAAGISRTTMSRIIHGHIPSDETLNRIAVVLEVSPGYLRGGYTMPVHLTEEDVLFFADLRNLPYIKLVCEAAEKGVTVEEIRGLVEIILAYPGNNT